MKNPTLTQKNSNFLLRLEDNYHLVIKNVCIASTLFNGSIKKLDHKSCDEYFQKNNIEFKNFRLPLPEVVKMTIENSIVYVHS